MKQSIFNEFCNIVYDVGGINLSEGKESLVAARVNKRMRILSIPTYEQYLDFLKSDKTGEEMIHLIDVISTNVTSFYREDHHFTIMQEVLKEWFANGQKRFRLWSAASSSGEEPYTMAITLCESINHSVIDARILATDISTRILAKAMAGAYDEDKLAPVSLDLRKKYFSVQNDGSGKKYTVNAALKKMLLFKRMNLSKPPFPMKGPMDIVFCRNVMIYFDQKVREGLLNEIHRLLKPGGYLMVGHSESLASSSVPFKIVKPSIYQKK